MASAWSARWWVAWGGKSPFTSEVLISVGYVDIALQRGVSHELTASVIRYCTGYYVLHTASAASRLDWPQGHRCDEEKVEGR